MRQLDPAARREPVLMEGTVMLNLSENVRHLTITDYRDPPQTDSM